MVAARCRSAAARGLVLVVMFILSWMAAGEEAPSSPASVPFAVDVRVEGPGIDPSKPLELARSFDLRKNIQAFLSIEAARKEGGLNRAQIAQLHRRAPREIRKALEPFGYYSPIIKPSLVTEGVQLIARYVVDPGPATRVRAVSIDIDGPAGRDPDVLKLIAAFPLQPGDVLRHSSYESGKGALLSGVINDGYLDARWITTEVLVSREQESATITLRLEAGEQFWFGPLAFSGEVIATPYLERYADFAEGEKYSPDKLIDLQAALFDTDYFASVDIYPRRDQAVDRHVPIDVVLTPRERFRYSAGAGYSTDTGARASVGWSVRRVNDRGDRFNATARASQIKKGVDLSYIIPLSDPRRERLEISSAYADKELHNGWEEKYVVGISRTQALSSNLVLTPYLNWSKEDYVLGTDSGKIQLLTPGARLSQLDSGSTRYPLRGYRWTVQVQGASDNVISDTTFIQGGLSGKWVRGLWSGGRVLVRGEVAATYLAALEDLPPSVRYFAGGDQSVRGYDYEDLSPNDEGGTQLLVGSVELEHRFLENWSAAVFFDAGNAMNDWSEPLAQGAGGGVRWLSPIGPVRVDVAWAITEPDNPYRFHITIGPDL